MSFNFPTAPQVNRQQALLAGGGAVVILAALAWFFFLRPANDAPAADTPTVSAAARARAAREAAIKKRQAAGGAPVAQAGAKAPANAKDSAAATLAAKGNVKGAAPKAGAVSKDSAALKTAAATPGKAADAAAKPAARDSAATKGAASKDSNIVVMREDFAFEPAGRRDPFVSLMGTEDIGPVVADLTLTGILWHPTRPVAVLRQLTGQKQQYRVTIGSVLGRMRVTQIKPKTVIFTIEEFGFNRRDSLILGDTTQVRAR